MRHWTFCPVDFLSFSSRLCTATFRSAALLLLFSSSSVNIPHANGQRLLRPDRPGGLLPGPDQTFFFLVRSLPFFWASVSPPCSLHAGCALLPQAPIHLKNTHCVKGHGALGVIWSNSPQVLCFPSTLLHLLLLRVPERCWALPHHLLGIALDRHIFICFLLLCPVPPRTYSAAPNASSCHARVPATFLLLIQCAWSNLSSA